MQITPVLPKTARPRWGARRILDLRFAARLCAASAIAAMALTGCVDSQTPPEPPPELIQLREQNKEKERLEQRVAEMPRLRKDFAEVQRLRQQEEEIERLRDENASLRQEIADAQTRREAQATAEAARRQLIQQEIQSSQSRRAAAPIIVQGGQVAGGDAENLESMEGDEILVDPRMLDLLVPGLNTSQIDRTEPVVVNQLLESQGISVTNYAQLIEMGLTNFIVRRNPARPAAESAQP